MLTLGQQFELVPVGLGECNSERQHAERQSGRAVEENGLVSLSKLCTSLLLLSLSVPVTVSPGLEPSSLFPFPLSRCLSLSAALYHTPSSLSPSLLGSLN